MDAAANKDEVRLRKGASLNERLVLAGFAVLSCLIAVPDLVGSANGQWPGIGAIFALLFGCFMLTGAILRRNIVWIITPDGILIGEQRPFGRLHSRLIRSDEISEMHLREDDGAPTKFSLVFRIQSGDTLISPTLSDVTQVHATTIRIARLLKLPDPEPVDNPLDAINPEIRLGKPIEAKTGEGFRILIVMLAGVLSFPFVYALWNSKLSGLGITVWSLGLIVTVVLFRYAHRMSGTFWTIRDGEIRVERRSLNGAAEVVTFGGGDVEAIGVEGRGDEGSNQQVLTIRLHDGRNIRSPTLAGKNEAQALCGEIVRRLNVPASARIPVW